MTKGFPPKWSRYYDTCSALFLLKLLALVIIISAVGDDGLHGVVRKAQQCATAPHGHVSLLLQVLCGTISRDPKSFGIVRYFNAPHLGEGWKGGARARAIVLRVDLVQVVFGQDRSSDSRQLASAVRVGHRHWLRALTIGWFTVPPPVIVKERGETFKMHHKKYLLCYFSIPHTFVCGGVAKWSISVFLIAQPDSLSCAPMQVVKMKKCMHNTWCSGSHLLLATRMHAVHAAIMSIPTSTPPTVAQATTTGLSGARSLAAAEVVWEEGAVVEKEGKEGEEGEE